MNLKDIEGWEKGLEKNQDSYGREVYRYAKAWAELMEKGIAEGEKIADIAEKTSHEADTNGITGFMYGCAVNVLSYTWEYGEELRKWHNLDCQVGTEGEEANKKGGVINPALLKIKRK